MLSDNFSGYTGEQLGMPNARGSTGSLRPPGGRNPADPGSDNFNPGAYRFSNVDTGFGGFSNADLKTLMGEILGYSIGGSIDPYTQVGRASDIQNVNPYTAAAFSNAQGVASSSKRALNDLFAGDTPDFVSSLMDRSVDSVMKNYSSGNALYSGAAQQTATDAAMRAGTDATSQYMNAVSGAFQGAAGIAGGLGQAEYFSPTYTQNPFFMSPMQAWSLDQTGTSNAMTNITGALSSGANIFGALKPGRD